MNTHTSKQKNQGYLRWKKQLNALNNGDFQTVQKLADEARQILEFKKSGRVRLPFVH